MSLEQAVQKYLRWHDANRGDDYFDTEGRAVRMPLDEALRAADVEKRSLARIRAAAIALVMKRFDWYFDNEDDQRELDPFWETLLAELGMTQEQIAAPGRALSEKREAERQADRDVEHARRRALTQEERDAEDAARWNAMEPMERHLFVSQIALYGACDFVPYGSKDGTFGSSTPWPPREWFPSAIVAPDAAITNVTAPEAPKARAIRITVADTGEVLWEMEPVVARVSVPKDGVAVAEFSRPMPSSDYQVGIGTAPLLDYPPEEDT